MAVVESVERPGRGAVRRTLDIAILALGCLGVCDGFASLLF